MKKLICVLFAFVVMGCNPEAPVESDGAVEGDSGLGVSEEELSIGSTGILRQELNVPSPSGHIHTQVVFRLSALRPERRLVVLIPGTLANGYAYYDIEKGTGWNAAETLANAGYIVAMLDLPGTGGSFLPADGRDADTALAADATRRVAQVYRLLFGIRGGVDLYGETGVGTNVALTLADESWVRSIALSATFYLQYGPAAYPLFSPEYGGFLDSLPTGYAPQDPAQFSLFFGAADPGVQASATAACLGPAPSLIPTGPFYDLRAAMGPDTLTTLRLDQPIVSAAPARAPALFIQGTFDPIGSIDGTYEMAADYGSTGGGSAEVVMLEGASHLMRFDSAISNGPSSVFWTAVLDFLDAN